MLPAAMDYPTTSMEYKRQKHPRSRFAPRLIIHGGAGNVTPATVPPEKRKAYREALFTIVSLYSRNAPESPITNNSQHEILGDQNQRIHDLQTEGSQPPAYSP